MFRLIVTLYLIVNGVAAEKPSGQIPNRQVFPTEEACKGYFDTEEGKLSKQVLKRAVEMQGEKFEMRVSCDPVVKGEQI